MYQKSNASVPHPHMDGDRRSEMKRHRVMVYHNWGKATPVFHRRQVCALPPFMNPWRYPLSPPERRDSRQHGWPGPGGRPEISTYSMFDIPNDSQRGTYQSEDPSGKETAEYFRPKLPLSVGAMLDQWPFSHRRSNLPHSTCVPRMTGRAVAPVGHHPLLVLTLPPLFFNKTARLQTHLTSFMNTPFGSLRLLRRRSSRHEWGTLILVL